ncbi:hypothetical protein [Nocardioides jejuensis]|uniref:Uncharacterized protein n=1 Tax=Nocardioides jejuensis TaxID=2502782 RepID=A0A4R1CIA6_9ACTN|nr:hypothetical protein [Nocardioides jejuensis]TCJ29856.1 hypothetical protein EPD65_06010 [Nocardioides jejuensis]
MGQRGVGRGVGLVAVAGGLLATLVFGTVAGAPPERPRGPVHVAPPETRSQAALFSCPEEHPVFTRHVPPIMDRGVQEEAAAWMRGATGPGWRLVFAEPTRLGLLGFIDGDLAAARASLVPRGVTHVYRRDMGPEFGDGKDRKALVEQGLGWALEKPMHDVRHALRGLPDDGDFAYWPEAGAIFVQWKAPLPKQVAALAGTKVDGAEVMVEETPYSSRELARAQDRIFDKRYEKQVDASFTFAGTCGDLSGVVLGVDPKTLGDRAPELQEKLSAIAGVPIHVIPEEPLQAL